MRTVGRRPRGPDRRRRASGSRSSAERRRQVDAVAGRHRWPCPPGRRAAVRISPSNAQRSALARTIAVVPEVADLPFAMPVEEVVALGRLPHDPPLTRAPSTSPRSPRRSSGSVSPPPATRHARVVDGRAPVREKQRTIPSPCTCAQSTALPTRARRSRCTIATDTSSGTSPLDVSAARGRGLGRSRSVVHGATGDSVRPTASV